MHRQPVKLSVLRWAAHSSSTTPMQGMLLLLNSLKAMWSFGAVRMYDPPTTSAALIICTSATSTLRSGSI